MIRKCFFLHLLLICIYRIFRNSMHTSNKSAQAKVQYCCVHAMQKHPVCASANIQTLSLEHIFGNCVDIRKVVIIYPLLMDDIVVVIYKSCTARCMIHIDEKTPCTIRYSIICPVHRRERKRASASLPLSTHHQRICLLRRSFGCLSLATLAVCRCKWNWF